MFLAWYLDELVHGYLEDITVLYLQISFRVRFVSAVDYCFDFDFVDSRRFLADQHSRLVVA